jgi:hypothetical protein
MISWDIRVDGIVRKYVCPMPLQPTQSMVHRSMPWLWPIVSIVTAHDQLVFN